MPAKKKKSSLRWKILLVLIVLLALSPFYYGYVLKFVVSNWRRVRDQNHYVNYPVYKSFHIRIPDKYSIYGVDVSFYQNKINWQRVKKMHDGRIHISFAFIKATQGLLGIDPYFQRNWAEAGKAGIVRGAYHYFNADKDGKWQARFCLQNVHLQPGDLPIVADAEELRHATPDQMRQRLKDFLEEIQAKTGMQPIIYTPLAFYQKYLMGYLDDYRYWIARYQQPELNTGSETNWIFWQSANRATVNGIPSIVDFNVFKGDSLAFRALLKK